MSRIRITKIFVGAPGTVSYNGVAYPQLDIDYSVKIGLLKYSRWLHNIKEGDCIIVSYKLLETLKNDCKDTFEFEITHPKYANHTLYSDTNPFEIIEWISENRVKIRAMDTADYTGVMGEYCETYISNPSNPIFEVREHKNGALYEIGTKDCPYILSDEPYYYRDPSF